MAEHEHLLKSFDSAKQETTSFNPCEQDEENFQYHNENELYFEASVVEEVILEDLRRELLENISQCSFMCAYGDKATVGKSLFSFNTLNKGQFV